MWNYRIRVTLTDEERDFVKRLAKHDKVSFHEELELIFRVQLGEEMELEEARLRGEQ